MSNENIFDNLSPAQLEVARKVRDEAIRQGVDPEAALGVAWIESKFKPNIGKSRAGASGVMQLMPEAERSLLKQGVISDPKNLDDNIKGGVYWLKSEIDKYGNVNDAVVAYNTSTAIRNKYFKSRNLNDLLPETRNYLAEMNKVYPTGGFHVSGGEPPARPMKVSQPVAESQPAPQPEAQVAASANPFNAYMEGKEEPPAGENPFRQFAEEATRDIVPPPIQRAAEEAGRGAIERMSDAQLAGAAGAAAGATAGAAKKAIFGVPEKLPMPDVAGAKERFAAAQDALRLAQQNSLVARTPAEVAAVRADVVARQAQLAEARANLSAAQRTLEEAFPPAPRSTGLPVVPTEAQHQRGVQGTIDPDTGATGRARQQTYNERTSAQATEQRRRAAELAELRRRGVVAGEGDLLRRAGTMASTPSGVLLPSSLVYEQQLAQQAAAAPEAARRAALEATVASSRAEVEAAEEAARIAAQAGRDVQPLARAQQQATLAQQALARARDAVPGPLRQAGNALVRSPILGGALGGAGAALSAQDAIERYKAGDRSGAVIAAIQGISGLGTLIPPLALPSAAVGLASIPVQMLNDYLKSSK